MSDDIAKITLQELRKAIPKISRISTKEAVIGVGYTAIRTDTDDIGLANTPLDNMSPDACSIFSRAGTLTDMPTVELAGLAESWDLSERVVGIAALNALSQLAIKKAGKGEFLTKYGDVIDLPTIKKKDVVVMIGNMRPAVERLRKRAKRVLVLERSIDLRDKGTYPDTAAEEIIPKGNVVFLTGATLCNGTTDRILELCRNAREVMMAGASAGIYPPALFKKGVTAVGAMEILDASRTMKTVCEGGGTFALLRSARYVIYERCKK